ncbi:hypothetical protein EG68_07464 [Paragonimus skrjabini miyazakii]|uniref:Transducer of regulated CREB activity N-terminal domain-containing protein n=1 Tax=Paragonimus skrjabini miyazakii TaxID=59628 RepID=A0A8S9YPR0_9TREM|nr:hypothetical protein EG68_07464 [Paragonimus skrjabini miyazakii]
MATKHLNAVNPRNFKEKIELLKKKEAASTANFAAAIRDAREIRKIACSYDPTILKSSPSVNIDSDHKCALQLPTSDTNTPMPIIPPLQTGTRILHATRAQMPVNTNEHLSSLSTQSLRSCRFDSTQERTRVDTNTWSTSPIPQYPNQRVNSSVYPLTCVSSVPSTCECARSQSLGTVTAPNLAPTGSPGSNSTRRRLPDSQMIDTTSPHPNVSLESCDRRFNTGPTKLNFRPYHTRASSVVATSSSATFLSVGNLHSSPNNNLSSHRDFTYYDIPSGASVYGTPSTHLTTPGFPASSLHWSSHHAPVGQGPPIISARPNVSGVDCRRVSSDSSIRDSLAASQTYPHDFSVSYQNDARKVGNTSSAKLPRALSTMTGNFYTSPNYKQSDLPCRLISPLPNNSANSVSESGSRNTSGGSIRKSIPDPSALSTDEHPLPAKRQFIPSCIQQSPHSKLTVYSIGAHHVTSKTPSANQNEKLLLPLDEHHSQYPPVFVQPSCALIPSNVAVPGKPPSAFSPSALNANVQKITAWRYRRDVEVGPTDDVTESLGDLSTCDPADLDRYLQIPSTLLDPDDGNNWPGRRDSCNMTAEVLSALAATSNGHSAPMVKCSQPDASCSQFSCYPKTANDPVADNGNSSTSQQQPSCVFDTVTHQNVYTSNFQHVADKLGISMSPNDYQLLTNPQLTNYVTDENTEAQLLQ